MQKGECTPRRGQKKNWGGEKGGRTVEELCLGPSTTARKERAPLVGMAEMRCESLDRVAFGILRSRGCFGGGSGAQVVAVAAVGAFGACAVCARNGCTNGARVGALLFDASEDHF